MGGTVWGNVYVVLACFVSMQCCEQKIYIFKQEWEGKRGGGGNWVSDLNTKYNVKGRLHTSLITLSVSCLKNQTTTNTCILLSLWSIWPHLLYFLSLSCDAISNFCINIYIQLSGESVGLFRQSAFSFWDGWQIVWTLCPKCYTNEMKEGGCQRFLLISVVILAFTLIHERRKKKVREVVIHEEQWLVNDGKLRVHWKSGIFFFVPSLSQLWENHIMSSNSIKDRKHLPIVFFLCLIFFLSLSSQNSAGSELQIW